MKALAARFVVALGEPGTPRPVISHDKFDLQFGRGVIGEADPTPLQILAWFDPPALIERLHAMIDAQPKPTNQMALADRKQRLIEIKDELFELECIEPAHIAAARAEGTLITQRAAVDVRALLGIVVSRPQASAA